MTSERLLLRTSSVSVTADTTTQSRSQTRYAASRSSEFHTLYSVPTPSAALRFNAFFRSAKSSDVALKVLLRGWRRRRWWEVVTALGLGRLREERRKRVVGETGWWGSHARVVDGDGEFTSRITMLYSTHTYQPVPHSDWLMGTSKILTWKRSHTCCRELGVTLPLGGTWKHKISMAQNVSNLPKSQNECGLCP